MALGVLIADDHDLVRDTIAAFLRGQGFAPVDVAASLNEVMDRIAATGGYDLVVLDYLMPGMNGLEGLARVRAAAGGRPVAILSGAASREVGEAALRAGAAGFLPKTLAAQAMAAAIRVMAAGESFAPFGLPGSEAADSGSFNLTRREIEVLRGICNGKSNKEIARDHDLQEVTVKLHVKTLSRKLGAKNRTHAAMIARDYQLV